MRETRLTPSRPHSLVARRLFFWHGQVNFFHVVQEFEEVMQGMGHVAHREVLQGLLVVGLDLGLPMEELHTAIRDVPKPVIARVQGFAIGGGNVLCTICDLTICSDKAIFGQVGPKMGSVDPGYGTAFLARVVGEKKAREIWYLNKRYSGQEAVDMGLANICVPHEQLDATVQEWAETICERSPTAIAIAKRSFNMDTAHQSGIAGMGMYALKLYYDTEESREGVKALQEKRKPDFRKYAK